MKNITFSFIIPHKNSPKLLNRCVNSIPRRDDVEIIVVDDNSDPEVVDWETYKFDNEKCITLIQDKTNKGAGHARNVGMNYAHGTWLLFADADDWYEEEINDFLAKYQDNSTLDLVYINAHCVNDKGESYPFKVERYIRNYLNHRIYSEKALRYEVWSPWTRIVRRDFVEQNKLSFEEIPLANDMKFGIESSYKARCIGAYPNIIYCYYKPIKGSLTDKKYTVETYMLRLQLKMKLNSFYNSVAFPFKWPLWTALSLHRFKDSKQKKDARKVRRRFLTEIGGYNIVKDFRLTLIFAAGKILKII